MENIFVEFLPPWIETGLQPAFYDKESGTVLQQTARMYARVNMLIRMFNKLSKNTKTEIENFEASTTETVNDYIGKFNELHDYVHDYFDNLDVQEEINNKLDAMAESGELQELITTYLEYSQTVTFVTVNDMMNSDYLTANYKVQTLGYYEKGDGGGCRYYIVDTEPVNKYYLKLKNGLFALILDVDEVTVDKLGAKKNNTTLGTLYNDLTTAQKYFPHATDLTEYVDYVAIMTACKYFPNSVNLNNGKYYVNKPILVQNHETKIKGKGYVNTAIQMNISPESLIYIIDLNEQTRCEFRDFTLMSAYSVPEGHEGTDAYLVAGFKAQNTQNNYFENVRGYNLLYTWYFNNTWVETLYRCRSNKCYKGVYSEGSDLNNITFRNCIFQLSHIGIHLAGGRTHLIDGCDIEDNDIGVYRELKGDIEITNTYFEDYLQFANNTTPIDNILISGCSFWIGREYSRLPAIRYDGTSSTKMTVTNCNFELAHNAVTQSTPAIASYTNANIADNVKPTVINANVVSQGNATTPLINSNFDGIIINKNVVYDTLTTKSNYINLDSNSSLTFDLHKGLYRFGGTGGGNSTITIPDFTSFYYDTQEWTIVVAGNISQSNTTSFTLTPSSNTTLSGQTTFTLGELSGKMIKIKWLGIVSSKNFWQIYVI